MTVPSAGPRLIDDSRRQFPAAALVTPESINTAPVNGGAYLLLIDLPVLIDFSRATLRGTFEPGFYVYAGSAYGPGGLRARIRRHMRRGKPSHWHVDTLTAAAQRIAAIPIEHGNECAVAEVMLGTRLFRPSLPGFGSSDCNRCISHLLEPVP